MEMKVEVEVVESTLVARSEETPRLGLWLSSLDLIVPRTHTLLVYCFLRFKI
jgi:shikimate O-hydroxycinnamoyltransferase